MKEIFSSLVFVVKFVRSRKFSVEIGRELKKGKVGRDEGVGRSEACLVINNCRRAVDDSSAPIIQLG